MHFDKSEDEMSGYTSNINYAQQLTFIFIYLRNQCGNKIYEGVSEK